MRGQWPSPPGCDDLCIRLQYANRTRTVLKVDGSDSAFDLSYDTWNYLLVGQSATANPMQGGGVEMEYDLVDMSECAGILQSGEIPLSALTSVDSFLSNCLAQPGSWVAQNYKLYNIGDAACTWGVDEPCSIDPSGLPCCPSQVNSPLSLSSQAVFNIEYGTGNLVKAL